MKPYAFEMNFRQSRRTCEKKMEKCFFVALLAVALFKQLNVLALINVIRLSNFAISKDS